MGERSVVKSASPPDMLLKMSLISWIALSPTMITPLFSPITLRECFKIFVLAALFSVLSSQ